MGRRRAAIAAAVAFAVIVAGPLASGSPAAAQPDSQPNIVFILTDDHRVDQFSEQTMPRTFRAIVERGTSFSSALAAPPLCCPYRAGFLTGQYPQNHGVYSNRPGYELLTDPENVLPTWLKAAGYRTAMVGKFLNHFEDRSNPQIAPGWDEWLSMFWLRAGMYNLDVLDNRRVRNEPGYITDAIADRAVSYITSSAGRRGPFFLWLSHISPHTRRVAETDHCAPGMAQPTAEDFESFSGPRFGEIRRPSFNARDVSRKPPAIQRRPRFDAHRRQFIRRAWRCAVTSLYAVDRSVGRVVQALRTTSQLDNTILVFGSDNGLFFGEHRLHNAKAQPYEEAFRVPFAMRVPAAVLGAEPPASIDAAVSQVDLTATLLELAGVEPCTRTGTCRRLDGRSFVPFLRGEAPWGPGRAIPYLLHADCNRKVGLRTGRVLYVQKLPRCGGGRKELYDLRRDPYQLDNVARERPQQVRQLRRRALRLRNCSGVRGRDEAIPGIAFCA